MTHPIPGFPRYALPRPVDTLEADLFGTVHSEVANLTPSQYQALLAFYGFEDVGAQVEDSEQAPEVDDANPRRFAPPEPRIKSKASPEALRGWYAAGVLRNALRYMERDGVRLMGLLAPFLEKGEDPVRLVEQLLMDAGFDIQDGGWGPGDPDSEPL